MKVNGLRFLVKFLLFVFHFKNAHHYKVASRILSFVPNRYKAHLYLFFIDQKAEVFFLEFIKKPNFAIRYQSLTKCNCFLAKFTKLLYNL